MVLAKLTVEESKWQKDWRGPCIQTLVSPGASPVAMGPGGGAENKQPLLSQNNSHFQGFGPYFSADHILLRPNVHERPCARP